MKLIEKLFRIDKLKTTIDTQKKELMHLRNLNLKLQLENNAKFKIGRFYVFNPEAGKPRKMYHSYQTALMDAAKVSEKENGATVYVLKVIREMPDLKMPF